MIKKLELNDPNSCLNRAKDGEMLFVLLGRDPAAPVAIRTWAAERVRLEKNKPCDPQILEAEACARAMGGGQAAAKDYDIDPRKLWEACCYAINQLRYAAAKEDNAPCSALEHVAMAARRLREAINGKTS